MTHTEIIKVIEHHANGSEIEYRSYRCFEWKDVITPTWNFDKYEYRIKEKPKTKMVHEWMFKDSLNQWFLLANLFTEDEAQKHLGTYAIILKTGRQWEVPND